MSEDKNTLKKEKLPTLFLTHGGGPCFFMDWNPSDTWEGMGNWLKNLGSTIGAKPEAIVIISGHWEEDEVTVMTNPKPPLFYDYYGFPEHTYNLKYDAPGSPSLASRVAELISARGFEVNADSERGFDHGVFIPLKMVYPDADIPVVQLSLRNDLDPAAHIEIGRALQPLREEGVLIVGSGSSFHNMRGFGPQGKDASEQFDNWLTEVVSIEDQEKRERELEKWESAPAGKLAHPREEHLIPLMVAAGAAGADRGEKVFSGNIMGVTLSSFRFG
jgi:aromatic ring-opening dioxygenase catalytic subunit (LigB family)